MAARFAPGQGLTFGMLCALLAGCSGQGWDGMELDGGDELDSGPDASPPLPADAAICGDELDAANPRCGELAVNGEINRCAQIMSYELSPLSATVGSEVYLHALVEDVENDPVSFEWTAAAGTFSQPGWPTTQYRCDAPGEFLVRLTVSDSPGCVTIEDIPVSCTSGL